MNWLLKLCVVWGIAAASVTAAVADPTYPSKTIRILVGFGPGSGSDLVSRLVATKLAELSKQSVIVENRPGAAGLMAAEALGSNNGDPYQIMWVTGTIVSSYLSNSNMKVDLLKDLAPLIQVGDSQLLLLVSPKVAANNYREMMQLFRQNPGKHNYGSAGPGSATHLFSEELIATEGVRVVHVPYKGTGQALTALMGGEIDMMFATQSIGGAPIKAKQVKAFAISGGQRTPGLPDIPTFAEAGNQQFKSTLISGFMVSSKVDPVIVRRLNEWMNQILAQKDVQEKLAAYDMTIKAGSPEQFKQVILDEIAKQKELLKKVSLK